MIISEELISQLSIENRKKLVDYMEGLPAQIKNIIKLSLSKPYMDRSFFNIDKRKIYYLSNLDRYLPREVHIIKVSNPLLSDYQKEYYACLNNINLLDQSISFSVKSLLESILSMDCYNIESLIKTEVSIGEFLNNIPSNIKDIISEFITNTIMPYKFKAYDFYTYLSINQYISLLEQDYSHMTRTHTMIQTLMKSKSNLSVFADIGILIYIYYKELGMEDYIQKYNLFDRFKFTMYYLGISEEYTSEVEERLHECINLKLSITGAASRLITSGSNLSDIHLKKSYNFDPISQSPDIHETDGIIFSFKNIKNMNHNEINKLAIQIRSINKDEILNYININPNNITFSLNENDIGHIRNENKISIGTAYDSFSKQIKYIIEKDGIFYALFKNRMNTRIVYGLSVSYSDMGNITNRSRNLITIKENNRVYFKYISEI